MHERVHVEVTKGDFAASWLSMKGGIGVGEDGLGVVKEVIQEVVLEVNAGEGFTVMMLYSERLSVITLRTEKA